MVLVVVCIALTPFIYPLRVSGELIRGYCKNILRKKLFELQISTTMPIDLQPDVPFQNKSEAARKEINRIETVDRHITRKYDLVQKLGQYVTTY